MRESDVERALNGKFCHKVFTVILLLGDLRQASSCLESSVSPSVKELDEFTPVTCKPPK